MESDTDTSQIFQRLLLIGYKPIYDAFRDGNPAIGNMSPTWRVCLLSNSCPSALVVKGSAYDQRLLDNKLQSAHVKKGTVLVRPDAF